MLLVAAALAVRGVRCEVLALSSADQYKDLMQRCVRVGVRFHSFSLRNVAWLLWRGAKQLALAGYRSNIVWSWGYRAELIRLLGTALWMGPGVFSIRSASFSQLVRRRWLLRIGSLFTERYISNSQLAVSFADRLALDVGRRSFVIRNALEPAMFANRPFVTRPSVVNILMLGNVRFFVKGYDIAISVAIRIKRNRLPFRIRIAGAQYDNEPAVYDRIVAAGLGDVISWEGAVSDSLRFLRTGHAFMLLSRYEGMPNALFEAMAVGLPCVATAVGDLPYYAADSNAFKVVPVEDADAAFRELCWIWSNWDEAQIMAKRGQEYCRKHFSEEAMVVSLIKALDLDRPKEAVI